MSDAVSRLNAALEGRYAVEREIGEGGMATVYLASDLKHSRNVALKVLKPELAAVVGADRFLAEIETTAGLQHPHILPLFDSGEADGFLFYVMPYIEGETLRERIDREKQLPVDEALGIATAVAHALQVAHDHGIVHRDIKPGNILMSAGEPLVSDFGIAIAIGAAGGNRLTETGLSVGTPYYMSPEQATGDQVVGPASDIYALGCVLYEMLVGEPPYLGNSAQAVLGKIIQGVPVSATAGRKAVPANVDAAIRKALEKLPADRFTRAADFSKALSDQHFRWGEGVDGPAGGVPGFWRPLALALGIVAALTTTGFAWGLLRPEPQASVSREVIAPQTFPLDGPLGNYLAIAPDGSSLVFPVVGEQEPVRLGARSRTSLEVTPIPGTETGRHPVYSPDGTRIVYAVGRELLVRPLVGGSTVTLADDVDDQIVALEWLEDGTIVYERESGDPLTNVLVRLPEGGGDPLGVVFQQGEGPERLTPIWTHALPRMRGLLVVTCPVSCTEESFLHVVDLDGGEPRRLLDGVLRAWYAPTEHVVYLRRDGAVLAAPFDLDGLELAGAAVPLFEGVRFTSGGRGDMVLGRDGTLVYVEGAAAAPTSTELVWVDRAGRSVPVDPGLPPRQYLTVALSPDDSRLAVDILDGSRDIWVKELPEGPLTRLTTDTDAERRPVWSRDGSTIAYLTNAGGTFHIRTVRSDGSAIGDHDVLVQRERDVFEVVYTPDEEGLVFREGNANTGEADMGFLDLETGEADDALLASRFNERAIALSPDGRWLAYVSDVTGRDEVFVRPFPDTGSGQRQVSRNGGIEPVWAHNGRELFYRQGPDGPMITATYSASGSDFQVTNREALFDASGYLAGEGLSWHSYDVTGDDQRFVMVRPLEGEEQGDSGRLVLVRNWFTELAERLN